MQKTILQVQDPILHLKDRILHPEEGLPKLHRRSRCQGILNRSIVK